MGIFDELFGTTQSADVRTATQGSTIPGMDATAQDAINEASRLYNQGPSAYYSGDTIAPQSPDTLQAMDMMRNRALGGSPLGQAAQDETMRTIQGDYLGANNPYLDQALTGAFDKARTGIDAQFSGAGRYGSALHKIGLGETFGNIAANTMAKEYESERNRQMEGMAMGPGMGATDYADIGALAGVGGIQDQYSNDLIKSDISKWNYERNAPADMLTQYMNMLSGGVNAGGTTSTSSQPVYTNNTANTLGNAAYGANLGGTLGSAFGGYGGIGAALGGLAGGIFG